MHVHNLATRVYRRRRRSRDGVLPCARQALDDDLPIDPAYCPYWKLSFEMATKADWLVLIVIFSLVCLFIASERRQQRCMREVRRRRDTTPCVTHWRAASSSRRLGRWCGIPGPPLALSNTQPAEQEHAQRSGIRGRRQAVCFRRRALGPRR